MERASQKGDVVNINFEGFINGEAFEGGKAEKYDLELGSNSFIPGFEDGLVGRSAGEEIQLKLKFPKDYGKEELKAKPCEFKVTINIVNEIHLPEVDKDFVKKLGLNQEDEESLKLEIRTIEFRNISLHYHYSLSF